ncbi:MAG: STAS domain-containing protein [Alteromonadaceae bacterium]|nr:STAS domain-containing protein [Alteromonadaceae bacterium]MBL4910520.1 STAS domain-containing protein [Alteromonadaceae bacterium]
MHLSVENEQYLLTGELTRHTVPCLSFKKLKKILAADNASFNFSHIDKVDTAGLAWMCALLEQANKQKCQLSFIHIPEQLAKLAKLSGVDDFLPID